MFLGESLEDYLETIYILAEDNKVRSIDVAKKMQVSKPSVNKAMNVLMDKGFITKEAYGDIYLTQAGIDMAKQILNRHETIRSFLEDVLHVSSGNAEMDACKIEHIISEETFEKITEYIK